MASSYTRREILEVIVEEQRRGKRRDHATRDDNEDNPAFRFKQITRQLWRMGKRKRARKPKPPPKPCTWPGCTDRKARGRQARYCELHLEAMRARESRGDKRRARRSLR